MNTQRYYDRTNKLTASERYGLSSAGNDSFSSGLGLVDVGQEVQQHLDPELYIDQDFFKVNIGSFTEKKAKKQMLAKTTFSKLKLAPIYKHALLTSSRFQPV